MSMKVYKFLNFLRSLYNELEKNIPVEEDHDVEEVQEIFDKGKVLISENFDELIDYFSVIKKKAEVKTYLVKINFIRLYTLILHIAIIITKYLIKQ